jgi:hypothetical protein
LVALHLQTGAFLLQFAAFALELGQGENLRQIGSEQPFLLPLQTLYGLTRVRLSGLHFLWEPGSILRPVECSRDLLRVMQNGTEVPPDEIVELLGGHIPRGALVALADAQAIRASATPILAIACGRGTSPGAQVTLAATHVATQQLLLLGIARGPLLVVSKFVLHALVDLLRNNGWHRNGYPLLTGPEHVAVAGPDG